MSNLLSRLAAHGKACFGLFADAAEEITRLRAKLDSAEDTISGLHDIVRSKNDALEELQPRPFDPSISKEELIASVPEHSIWRHHSGRIYRVLFLTNTASDDVKYPYEVIYKGPGERRWSGRLDDWHRRMTRIDSE
jgi:hypothetical protein